MSNPQDEMATATLAVVEAANRLYGYLAEQETTGRLAVSDEFEPLLKAYDEAERVRLRAVERWRAAATR